MKHLGAIVLNETKDENPARCGKGFALRQGISAAVSYLEAVRFPMSRSVIAFFEPEKADMVQHTQLLSSRILQGVEDITIPARTQRSWDSYPVEQQYSEKFGNYHLNNIARECKFPQLDWFFGPVLFRASLARYWIGSDAKSWDAQILPFIHAWFKTRSFDAFVPVRLGVSYINYQHPLLQKLQEEGGVEWGRKRLKQLNILEPVISETFSQLYVAQQTR